MFSTETYVLFVTALNRPIANPFLFLPEIFVAFRMPIELGLFLIVSFSSISIDGTCPILLE